MAEFLAVLVAALKVLGAGVVYGGSAAVALAVVYQLSRIAAAWREEREKREREARRVIAGIDQIKTQPQDPPAPYVARSPLADAHAADRAELAGIVAYKTTAAAQYGRPAGAHRADGPRDPRRRTWRRDTQIFAAIAEAASGEELVTVGPREKEIRCVRTGGLPALTAAGAVR